MRSEWIVAILMIAALSGCHRLKSGGGWEPVAAYDHTTIPNPLTVPLLPREMVMDEVSDEIDNYFRILREQRIRLVENVLSEGWIDTEPKIGSTILEPWRSDSSPGFERAHATLQTVRRWAKVRVIPDADRYWVDVKVFKELEDLDQPEHSTVSGKIYRHDNSLDDDLSYGVGSEFQRNIRRLTPRNRGWIPMGRDIRLEQTILGELQKRFFSSQSHPSEDGQFWDSPD